MLIISILITALIVAAIAWYIVRLRLLQPLDDVAAVAVVGDDLTLPEVGPPQLVSLARAFNELTAELLSNQQRLADNVQSLDDTNRRLVETQRELVQAEKLASLGQLAAGVAHEIGNPLSAVMGYVSVQKRRAGNDEIVEGLERETRRIDRIVRELLDYARPASEQRLPVDINQSLRRVADLLKEQGWLSGIELDLDLDAPIPPVQGDPHRIDQIWVNLLRNAEMAMDGEGRIAVRSWAEEYHPPRPIPVRRADDPPGVNYSHLRRDGVGDPPRRLEPGTPVVRISITDSGPGIKDEVIASIFDPFFTTRSPGEGSGLGLAIVSGTVAELGGRIEASSEEGEGATFSLWLPAMVL